METFAGFTPADFAVFTVPGFHERMSALRMHIRPKLVVLGEAMAPGLSAAIGHEMIPHVASHARRRVNPPEDTWVSFSRSPRGYKRYAHFEVGLTRAGVFVRFVLKAEGVDDKPRLLELLARRGRAVFDELKDPDPIYWFRSDHGDEPHPITAIDEPFFARILEATRLKSRGFTVGVEIGASDPLVASPALVERSLTICRHLAPLYWGTVGAGPEAVRWA